VNKKVRSSEEEAQGGHFIHFRNYMRHNIDRSLLFSNKIYKELTNKSESIQSRKSNTNNVGRQKMGAMKN